MKKIPLIIAIIGIAVGYVLLNPVKFGICQSTYYSNGHTGCFDEIKDQIGAVVELFSIALFVVSVPLLFSSKEVLISWFKFARIWLPVALFFTAISSPHTGVLSSPGSRVWAVFFFLVVFLIISFVIIVRGLNKKRGK
ncbi:MAG: hypothetical protein PHP62_00360 [Candidatus Moranbacteria bacterium]|nr:hypothetical protein [Candidatus Moranbacteria bacterium]